MTNTQLIAYSIIAICAMIMIIEFFSTMWQMLSVMRDIRDELHKANTETFEDNRQKRIAQSREEAHRENARAMRTLNTMVARKQNERNGVK